MKSENSKNENGPYEELDRPLPKQVAIDRWETTGMKPKRYIAKAEHIALRWRGITITLERITPERAAFYKTRVPDEGRVNRDFRQSNLKKLCRAGREGAFLFNGDPIVFNEDDFLIDGKHRIEMCILENITIVAIVVRGVPKESFATIDIGAPKLFHDMLFVRGCKDTKNLASALKIVDEFKTTGKISETTGGYAPNDAPLLDERYPNLCDYGVSTKQSEDFLTKSLCMALHYLMAEKDKVEAEKFMMKLVSGIGITEETDPHFILRESLRNLKKRNNSAKTGINRRLAAAYVIKVWNGHMTNKPVKSLKLMETEDFPKILGPTCAMTNNVGLLTEPD